MMNIYLLPNFHNYQLLIGAFQADKNSRKMIFCDKKIEFFVAKYINAKYRTYDLKKIKLYVILSPILKLFSPQVNFFIQSRIGQQNLIAASFFKVKNFYVLNEDQDKSLTTIKKSNLSNSIIKLKCSEIILRRKLEYFKWEHIEEPGIKFVKYNYKLINPMNEIVQINHNYDCIILDFETNGLNIEESVKNIKIQLKNYKRVAIKKHPMNELGIGNYLPYEVIDIPLPVELFNSSKTVFYYVTSAAKRHLNNKINIFPYLVFLDEYKANQIKILIQREEYLYNE